MHPGWVYANAAELGASKIGGSIIFPRSALIEALKKAELKPREANEGKGKSSNVVSIRKKAQKAAYNTDPSKYGIANFLYMMARSEESETQSEDVFAGIEIQEVIEALKQQ